MQTYINPFEQNNDHTQIMHKIQFRNFGVVDKCILRCVNGKKSPQIEQHFSKFSIQFHVKKRKITF